MILVLLASMIPSCTSVLTLDVPASVEADLNAHLNTLDASACQGAEVGVLETSDGYAIIISRDGQQAETQVTHMKMDWR